MKCFGWHGGKSAGFCAQIECAGKLLEFSYKKPMCWGDKVVVAKVIYDGKGSFKIREEGLKCESGAADCAGWGLRPNTFVPVSTIMLSPNCWDQQCIGEKRYFFMLGGCVNRERPGAFREEYLKHGLRKAHGKVMKDVAEEMVLETVEDQLSGFGFSESLRKDQVLRVIGNTRARIFKIRF